ncbi:antitoxin MazE family protein [Desulfurivibrio sp. D14AmB]|uniref:antitoxin MazE family protein n=1 Tax=Desulfurivibrio sp. D14AmB TaxID=3374370 RepID=UPI00376F40A9
MIASSAARVRKHREGLRKAGLRPVQIWVPDTRKPSFAKECRRQSAMLLNDPDEREVLNWIETGTDVTGWE